MEYEFIFDPMIDGARAKFSFEHEVFGPWLEVEVGNQSEKITELLNVIAVVSGDHSQEVIITGHEYSAIMTHSDVTIKPNTAMNNGDIIPEDLVDDELNFDAQGEGQCGIEDFRELLLSWARFNKV